MADAQKPDPDPEDPWGDEDDDELFLQASQMMEEEEKKRIGDLKTQNPPEVKTAKRLSPRQAATAFNMRREHLHDSETQQNSIQTGFPASDSDNQFNGGKNFYSQYQSEKERNTQIVTNLQAAQGESENLRRQVEKLKQARQEELIKSLQKEREEKQRHEDERRGLVKEKNALQTELRSALNELTSLKSKAAFANRLSIGGSVPQPVPFPRQPVNLNNSRQRLPGPRYKSGSDPNLTTPQLQQQQRSPTPQQQPQQSVQSPVLQKVVETSSAFAVADESVMKLERQDNLVFASVQDKNIINVHQLDSVSSLTVRSTRQRIFSAISSLIRTDFLVVQPTLEKVAKTAPTEIMARFAPGSQFKVCFPDFTDSMFLCGVQAQRKKEGEATGEYVEVTYPSIPLVSHPAIIDLKILEDGIATHLEFGGIWATLKEILRNLKLFLQGLNGDKRFRLYEMANLSGLWHLLAWAKHLWEIVVMEEELEFVVQSFGKDTWTNELKQWSGIVLKIDWRDYYLPEIESIIRRLSLSILETIVTLGYFEESQKRYEILYCIMKDTLLKNHLRNQFSLRQCLVIATWTIADKNILNYLCLDKKNKNCLARLLGEAALQFFKETKNDKAAVNVLIHFLNFLENLMVRQPHYLYASKIARPDANAKRQKLAKRLIPDLEAKEKTNTDSSDSDQESEDEEKGEELPKHQLDQEEAMDVDLMQSQFACPDKYKFEDGSRERAMKFNNVKDVKCWINPVEWEVKLGYRGEKPCQCRKILLGSAFIMLNSVIKFWAKAYLDHEEKVEENQEIDREEKVFRMETGEIADKYLKKLQEKSNTWRVFIMDFLSSSARKEDLNDDDVQDGDTVMEWGWDELINYQRKNRKSETEEPEWTREARRPENSFDYVMREGAKLMGFCNENSYNLALAVGSEGFSCFTFLESFYRFYGDNAYVTIVERKIALGSSKVKEEDDEVDEGQPQGQIAGGIFDVEEDDLLDFNYEENISFNKDAILEGLSYELPPFTEAEFDKSFRLLELERMKK